MWSRVLVSPVSNIDRVPGLRELQASGSAARGVTVAVIDGPVDLSHPAFRGADITELREGIGPSRYVDASRVHGTHVTSILFGQPGGPVEGIVPGCRGLLIPVFADSDDGSVRPCSEVEMARAILAALKHGANVINISAGRMSGTGSAGMHLSDAIRICAQSGVLVVAAAGNDGCDCHQVPAALPEVLAVGAMDERGDPVGFSNWGTAYRKGGVLAPGTGILGADGAGGAVAMSGTSFATPIVSGVAALLMAMQIEAGGKPDGRAVLAAILEGADACDSPSRGDCERHLAGTLNVAGAVRRIAVDAAAAMDAATVPRSRLTGLGQRSAIMDEQHGDVSMAPQGSAASPSIEALTASLKAMEGMMGELSRTLGSLRPSGVGYTPQAAAEPLRPRLDAEPAPTRSDLTLRPSGRRSVLRSSAPRDGDLLLPSACCDACAAREARQLVFALGKLGYDFGTEARMDSIQSQMSTIAASNRDAFPSGVASAANPLDLVKFLQTPQGEPASPAITWTLNLNETAIYAIQPEGYYVKDTYQFLVRTLEEQTKSALVAAAAPSPDGTGKGKGKAPAMPVPVTPAIERMSLPGVISGETELMNGLVVPSVQPALAGMFTWRTEDLVKALENYTPPAPPPRPEIGDIPFDPRQGLATFLSRIYEELRNVGRAPQDRALNFAATNAYQASDIFVKLRGRNIHIEKFEVVRSPVMRPDLDCWDVKMIFYNPAGPTTSPREVYFFTVDVSDVVPVAIGTPRHWTMY